jgi:predicted phosphodiesterase
MMNKIASGSRIAILADIHGNSLALDAVLADIVAQGGADAFWLLGDYAAIGHDPTGVLERIDRLDNRSCIRGNTDRYLIEGSQPWPQQKHVDENPELFPLYLHIARSFAWTTGAVAVTGWLDWLQALPLEYRAYLPDGTRVLAVHASPGEDDGTGIHPGLSDKEIQELTANAACDLLLVGHTHVPFDRSLGTLRVVNPGSVSNPLTSDLRAAYALLEISQAGYELSFQRVDYDRQAVVELSQALHHPAAEYIAAFMHGERRPGWTVLEDGD